MSYNYNYGITFTGYNMATSATESVSMGLMQVKYGATEAAKGFDMLGYRSLMSLRGMVFGLQMGLFYLTMFAAGLDRTENYTISVERAQRKYDKAVRESGRGSEQAQNALESLTMAQNNYEAATTRSTILTVALGLQAVSMGISFMQALPAIQATIASLTTLNSVMAVSVVLKNMLLSPWAPLALGLGVATAVGVGYAMSQPPPAPTQPAITVINEDIVQQYLQRRGTAKSSIG